MVFPKEKRKPATELLSVRLTVEEIQRLRDRAAARNLRLSDLVRMTLQTDETRTQALLDKAADRKLPDLRTVASLARANNNLNQIARALNIANKAGSPVTLRHLVEQLKAIQEDLTAIRQARK